MGDDKFLNALSGKDLYAYAALKSMPFVDEGGDDMVAGPAGGSSSAGQGRGWWLVVVWVGGVTW